MWRTIISKTIRWIILILILLVVWFMLSILYQVRPLSYIWKYFDADWAYKIQSGLRTGVITLVIIYYDRHFNRKSNKK
ncbi:MAG: hypothetical protein PWP51_2686 [Clostridiales bacterium]|jgi:multisubunit Na+/H+ antiporter MnhB subunit|nr:hypothetical protein [Clostridiales bacterium]MDN5300133.1 hypothetical protein [Clostridiales bacterium]